MRQGRGGLLGQLSSPGFHRREGTQGLQGRAGDEGTSGGERRPGPHDGHGEGRQGGHRETEGEARLVSWQGVSQELNI